MGQGVRYVVGLLATIGVAFANPTPASSEPFYSGKRITFVVPTTPGGSFDATARVVARYLPEYLPGRPTVIVQNMPGAGGKIGSNYLFKLAKPDGLTIGHVSGYMVLMQMLKEPGVEFDMLRFEWLGALGIGPLVLTIAPNLPYTKPEELQHLSKPLQLSATGRSSNTFLYAVVLDKYGGLRLNSIFGYPGAAQAITAIQRGEVDGRIGSYSAMLPFIEQGIVKPIVRSSFPTELPKLRGVELDRKFVKPAGYPLLDALDVPQLVGRSYAVPPGTPSERVEELREAFTEVMQDPGFIGELQKMLMIMGPEDFVSGSEVAKHLRHVVELPGSVWQEFTDAMNPPK